ncbi:MAG: hypothetical protein ACI4VW_03625 [Acutalibacteraceae bacterium]
MFSEQVSFSDTDTCGAFSATRSSACPDFFNNAVTLLCTAVFAVLILLLGTVLCRISASIGIAVSIVVLGFLHFLLIAGLQLNNR